MTEFKTSPKLRREAGLKRIAGLLAKLRSVEVLREGSPGTFRHRSRAFLHFHYHPDGKIVADVRLSADGFVRFDVSTAKGRTELLGAINRFLNR